MGRFLSPRRFSPPGRKRGVGTALFKAILQRCREVEAGYVFLLATHDGEPLYKKFGFSNIPYPAMRLWGEELAGLDLTGSFSSLERKKM